MIQRPQKIFAILLVIAHIFTFAVPVHADEITAPAMDANALVESLAESTPSIPDAPAASSEAQNQAQNTLNLLEGTTTNMDSLTVDQGAALLINIMNALGQVCPECRAILQTNNFTNMGQIDIMGFLAIIAPVIINEGKITTTGGLLLSNLGIDEQAFFNGMAELSKANNASADSYVLNKGEIEAVAGKIIALIGANGGVHNLGKISANGGAIAMVSGDKVSFPLTRDGVMDVNVEGLTGTKGQVFDSKGKLVETDGLITNSGLLQASGGLIVLSAAAREKIYDQMINITGAVEAKGVEEKDGEIILSAGDEGNVAISGSLNASASENGAQGGKINITGNDIEVLDGARIEALGYGMDSNGGSIFVMGQGTSSLNAGSLLDASAGGRGDGGFIEFSAKSNVELAGGVMRAEAKDGDAGNILIDPATLVISTDQFTGGANVTYQADNSITVNPGVIISSRQIAAGGNHETANSAGNSGNLVFESNNITVGSGAKILAQGGNGFNGGDISLLATHNQVGVTPFINYNDANAKITIDNAVIKGDTVFMKARAEAGRTFTDGDNPLEWGIGLLNVSGGPSTLFGGGIAVAYSDAQIEVTGSTISGTDVTMFADARSDATVTLLGGEGVMVGYAETDTVAKVSVTGSTINADNVVDIHAKTDAKTESNVTIANLGTRGQAPIAVTFSGAEATATTEAKVDGTSTITAGSGITVNAEAKKFQNVNASGGAYTDGTLGVAVGISHSQSITTASLDGTATATTGDVNVFSSMDASKNDTAAAAAAGSGLVAGLVVGGLNGAINGVFNKNKPATTKDPQSQPIGLSAGFALSQHSDSVKSEIADGAIVKAGNNVNVDANVKVVPETSAIATVDTANMTNDTKKNVAISAAVVIGSFENKAEARIGVGAKVDAKRDIDVHAKSSYPYQIQWDQISGISDVLDKLNPNLGVQNGLFTSWAQSQATGEDVGIAGSVNILTLDNTATAYIDESAEINQTALMRTDQQDVKVRAESDIETLNISGNFGLNPVSTGGAKGGIGASYLGVDYTNNVYAGIKTGAKVSGETVAVTSDVKNKTISIAESGGKGGQYGFNGAFSFQGVDDTVVSQIDDGSTIDARADAGNGVLVHAKDEAKILNIAGGISKGGNVGIGTTVSLNEIERDTRARIGNEDLDTDSATGSVSADSDVTVEAVNTGLIGSYSLAAAFVMPDAKTPSAGNFGIGISGDVSLNKIRDNASASIDDSEVKKANNVTVSANNGGEINSVSGAVTINTQSGTSVGLAGSYTNNDIVSNVNAFVDNSIVDITGDVNVTAKTDAEINSINASGSGASAAGRAIAGSTAYNDIEGNTKAYFKDSDVKNSDEVTVKAIDESEIFGVAGSIAGGGKGGSGSGAVNNKIKSDIKAYSQDSDIKAGNVITFDSKADGKIEGYAASIGIATSGSASSGSVSDNEVEMISEAFVKGKKSLGVRSDSDINLKAVNDADIFLAAGNISGSGQSGYGRSTGANDIDNDTRVYVDGGRLDSKGKIDMKAESTGTIKVVTVGGSGTAGNSAAAGVSDNDIRNIIESKIISDSDVDAAGDIALKASDTSVIQALGGVVAGGGNNSIGAVVSLNDVANQILTTIDDSTVTTTGGAISLDAYSKNNIDALAASGAFGGQAGLSGAVTLNEVENDIWARVLNGADVDASGKVRIEAYDESTIRSLAGAVTVGSNSLGGSVATNDITNEVYAFVDGSTVESTGNSVEVKATEKATIETVSVGGAFAGSNSLGGSVSLNDIDNKTKAYVKTPSTAGATTAVAKGNLDVLLQAEDTSKIQSFAGQVGGAGSTAVAGAVATNDISNETQAFAEDSDLTATHGYVAAKSTNDSTIETFAIAGGTAGTAALAGSVAINTIANITQAYLSGTHTTADDTVVVAAKAKSTVQTLGGVLSGGGTAGIGGTVVLNTIDNLTKAYVGKNGTRDSFVKAKGVDAGTVSKADGTTGTDFVNGLAVVAESIDDVDTKSATLAAGGVGSIASTTTVNLVENDTQAYIENTAVNNDMSSNSNQSVKVRAYSGTDVDMKGGGLSAGGAAGIGATVDKTTVANTTKSYIKGNTVKAENGVEVKTTTDETVNSIIASGGIAGTTAVTGSVAVIDVDSTNEAYIEGANVDAKGDIKVLADDDVDVDAIAGSLSIGGVSGAGGSVVVTNIENDTTARITDAKTNATGVTEVNADSNTDVNAYTASGSLGGYAGVGGAVTVNTIATTTKALINEVSGTTEINENTAYAGAGQDVKVIAKDTTKLSAKDGNIAGGVAVGIGAAIDVATVRNTATASIGDNTKVSADRDVLVQASSNKDVDSVAVAASGGAGMGVAGSVSIVNVGSAITGEGNTAAASTSSFTNSAIGNANGSRAGNSDAANSANAKITAQGSPSAADEFNTAAAVSQSTTASIGSSAIVDAGGDITVDADDITEVDVIAGALSVGGLYGIGGAVGLVNLKSRTNATVGSSADLTAGDDITIDGKGTVNESIIQTIAGSAGQISLGAAFTRIISDNDVTTSVGNNAKIRKADQFQVLAENYSNIQAESYGASIGAGAVGVSLAEGTETGTAAASLGSGVDVADEANSKKVNDVLVQAKASNYVQGYAVAAAGGIVSGTGSSATAKANANTSATIGSNSNIDAENDITVKSYSRNNADADALGVSVGGLTVGVALSYAETAPNVTASVNDSSSGSGTKLNAKRDVTIVADSDENANAYSQSAAGGVISGNGSDADSRTAPTVKAILGNNNEIDARDALIKAYSITYSYAQAAGISAGGLAVAASLADAVTNAVVQAYTGHNSKVRATRNAKVLSTFNIYSDGTYLDNRTQAHSNASAGALVGITGTKSSVNSSANTGAWISTGSLLKGGNDATIQAIAQNDTYVNAVGKAGGLLAGGYTGFSSTLNTYAEALIYGTGEVEAGNNSLINAQAYSDSFSNAEGGAGQDIGGALEALFTGDFSAADIPSIATVAGTSGSTTVNNTAVARTETGSSVKSGNDSTVSTLADTEIYAKSYMSSTGVFVADAIAATDVYADSDALTTIGGHVEGKTVKILAQNNVDINAIAQADVHADIAAGFATAITRVRVGDSNDPAEAKIVLTATSSILGTVSVLMQALNYQQAGNLISKAVAKAYGTFTATSSTLADGTAYLNSKIQQDSGSTITTGDLAGTVNTTYSMDRISEPTAETVVTKVIQVARTVVREVCSWLPWPLDAVCDYVTEVVFDLVTVIDPSFENSDIAGAGLAVGDNITLNGDIYNIGAQNREVVINADGTITGGTGSLSGNDVLLGDIQNDAKSKIRFNAEKGTIGGTGTIHLNKVLEEVKITNNSDYNLVVGKVNMISNNGGEPDVIYNAPTSTKLKIAATSGDSQLIIDNNGKGNLVFTQSISNNLADFDFFNQGGSILAQNSSVAFDMYHASLRANNGNLGSSSQRLNFNLFKAKTLPDSTVLNTDDASLNAFSYGDMFLNIDSVQTEFAQYNAATASVNGFDIGDLTSFGNIDVQLQKGNLYSFYQNPACLTCSGLKINEAPTTYNVQNVTAGKNVKFDVASGVTLTLDGTMTSGIQDITFDVDAAGNASNNLFEHEIDLTANKIILKDIAHGGGNIKMTGGGSLNGTGTLKSLDGYSQITINNASGLDLEIGNLNVDTRINSLIDVFGDTSVVSNEYGSVKVGATGLTNGALTINNTGTGSDVFLNGQLQNTSGKTTINVSSGDILNTDTDQLLKSKDIDLTVSGKIGQGTDGIKTDLQGGKIKAAAGNDIILTEVQGDMNIDDITSNTGDVTAEVKAGSMQLGTVHAAQGDLNLKASASILDALDSVFGEHNGGAANLFGRSALLTSGTGIGTSTNGVEMRLADYAGLSSDGRLEAFGGNGGIFVSNKAATGHGLTLGFNGSFSNALTAKGGITVLSGSPMTVNSNITETGGGNVLLSSLGNNGADDLILNSNISTSGGNGSITLTAGDSIALAANKTVTAAGAGDIKMFAGEDWSDLTQDQDGNTGANGGSVILPNSFGPQVLTSTGRITLDAANDVNLTGVQTGSNENDAVSVTARAGSINDAGQSGDFFLDITTGAGGQATLKAATGIGTLNALETAIGNLDAINTTSGNIEIDEVPAGGNLGVNRAQQLGAGIVNLRATNGTLTVNAGQPGVSATSGDISLIAANTGAGFGFGSSDLVINSSVISTSGDIFLTGYRDILFGSGGDVTSVSGNVTAPAGQNIIMADGAVTNAGSGKINFTAYGGDISLSSVQTTSSAADAVLLTAAGEIRDSGDMDTDIIAQQGTTTLTANTGIGSLNALETKMANVSGMTDQGNIQIDNTGALNIVTANGVTGLSIQDAADLNLGNFITVRTFSPLTVTAGSPVVNHAGGDIALTALGKLDPDDLTLSADVITDGGNGNILLTAGDTIRMDDAVKVSAQGSGNITAAAGEDFTDGVLNQDGNIGPDGGDIIMAGTAVMQTESGNILADAADDFFVGVLNADSNNDEVRGDVTTFSRAGNTLDSNATDLNIIANNLTMTAGGALGASGDPLELKVRNLTAKSGGSMFFFNFGSLQANLLSTEGSIELGSTDDIILGTAHASNGGVDLNAGSNILSLDTNETHIVANSTVRLNAGNVLGTEGNSINVQLNNPGTVFVNAEGSGTNGLSANVRGNFSASSLEIQGLPPGLVLFNGIAVGGANMPLLTTSTSGLYSAPLPMNSTAFRKLDGFFTADFPGIFNSDVWSAPTDFTVDTTALDELPSYPFTLPFEEKEETPAPKTVPVLVPAQPAPTAVEQEKNPPAVVPIPAKAAPSETQNTEQETVSGTTISGTAAQN